jgi:hypothetical protein
VFADFDRGFDVIRDFVPGTDQIVLDHEGMDAYDDLRFIRYMYEDTPSLLIRFLDADGVVDRTMGGVVLKGIDPEGMSERDFLFELPPPPEETPEPPPEEVPEPPEESVRRNARTSARGNARASARGQRGGESRRRPNRSWEPARPIC